MSWIYDLVCIVGLIMIFVGVANLFDIYWAMVCTGSLLIGLSLYGSKNSDQRSET